jgi:hypothetical protein
LIQRAEKHESLQFDNVYLATNFVQKQFLAVESMHSRTQLRALERFLDDAPSRVYHYEKDTRQDDSNQDTFSESQKAHYTHNH